MKIWSLVDTHAHIADPSFDTDREEVLTKAERSGITRIITVSETVTDAIKNMELAQSYFLLAPAAGIHPSGATMDQAEQTASFIQKQKHRLCAIGEVGLDYWTAKEPSQRELQKEIFSCFIKLSLDLDLPLNVHSRSAGKYAIDILLREGARRVQLHAFDGKASAAMPGVEAGFYFSIPPSVVRSTQKQKLITNLPLTSLLVETDSPVLGPSIGQRNEPSNCMTSVMEIARLKDIGKEEVIETLRMNTHKLYSELIH
ncbi:MAG: TatD family hydrolase [Spirochaetota bacterium]